MAEVEMAVVPEQRVDLHLHSDKSSDGWISLLSLVKEAKGLGLSDMAITDHNTGEAYLQYCKTHGISPTVPMINIDGVNVLAGVEVTCRISSIPNLKDNPTKVHILVYGADMSPKSPLGQLLELKRKNDIENDYGILLNLLKENGITHIGLEDIKKWAREQKEANPKFFSIGKKEAGKFLADHNITLAQGERELWGMISRLPRPERLNIELEDLVKLAKASGGIVVVAHPEVNFRRVSGDKKTKLARCLAENTDGCEVVYASYDGDTHRLLDKAYKCFKKTPIYTGGTDTHGFEKGYHLGRVRGKDLNKSDFSVFFNTLDRLRDARAKGVLSIRKDFYISDEEIADILEKYKQRGQSVSSNFKPANGKKKGKKRKVLPPMTAREKEAVRIQKLLDNLDSSLSSGEVPFDDYNKRYKELEKKLEALGGEGLSSAGAGDGAESESNDPGNEEPTN